MQSNQIYRRPTHETNKEYQRKMARSLVKAMGVSGAIEFATDHDWLGVLNHISLSSGE